MRRPQISAGKNIVSHDLGYEQAVTSEAGQKIKPVTSEE